MTFVPARTLEDVLEVALPGVAGPSGAGGVGVAPDAWRRSRLLHLSGTASATDRRLYRRSWLRPRVAAGRDPQRPRATLQASILLRTPRPWLLDRTCASPFTLDDGRVRHRGRPDRQPSSRCRGDGRGGPRVLPRRSTLASRRKRRCCRAEARRSSSPTRRRWRAPRRARADVPSVVVAELHLGLDLRGYAQELVAARRI